MNGYRGLRCLVTGGAGFIGSNLTRRLLESGAEVTVLDNLFIDETDEAGRAAGNPEYDNSGANNFIRVIANATSNAQGPQPVFWYD